MRYAADNTARVLNNKVEGENAMGGTPVMVIDEECFIDKNMDLTLVAKVKSIESLPNLRVIYNQEGFEDITIWYLGGFWVALEFCLHMHVDIEGVPLVAWTPKTFEKIAQRWGELLFNEIIIQDRISVIRTREIIRWNLEFIDEDNENDSHSKVESEFTLGSKELGSEDKAENGLYDELEQEVKEKEGGKSDDPFGLYDPLKKGNQHQENSIEESDNISKPLGFKFRITDKVMQQTSEGDKIKSQGNEIASESLSGSKNHERENIIEKHVDTNVEIGGNSGYRKEGFGDSRSFVEGSVPSGYKPKMESSLLEKLNDFVKIRQAMSYSMKGCLRNIKELITEHGVVIVMGDFNKVRMDSERYGSIFHKPSADAFNHFITSSGLNDIPLGATFPSLTGGKDARKGLEKKRFEIQSEIRELDKRIDSGCLSASLTSIQASLHKSLLDLDKIRDMKLIQKAKLKWAVEGDENSRYFPGVINKRRHQRSIRGVLVNGEWIENPDRVKREFHDHFASCFSNSHATRKFPIGCNPSFISLIPKISDAKFMKDFWPISLIGYQYKIVGKILANRLSMIIDDLVSSEQSAFIKGRQILDGPMILNEVLSWCNNKKKRTMIFKVDFEKTFDSVRWDFLDDILHKFVFGSKWRGWIAGCLKSSMGLVLVNGSPTKEFRFQNGIRQGDPLSPFLFLLVMEFLHISFSNALQQGFFKGVGIGTHQKVLVSHLFYANDVVFIGEWRDTNFKNIISILQCFYLSSGLRINVYKCSLIGVDGVTNDEVTRVARLIGCEAPKTSFKSLGVVVGDPMSRSCAWDNVMDRVVSRLSNWKARTLSIGGRLTLIKSMLGSLPTYYFSLFKIPSSVLKKLESLRSCFFRGANDRDKKMTWVSWDKVLANKKNGGLGVNSFFAMNIALLFKWVWHFKIHKEVLWVKVVKSIHRDYGGLENLEVGDGKDTLFWLDPWLEDGPFKCKFPRVYALEENKHVSVGDKLNMGLSASLRRFPRGGAENSQMNNLRHLVNEVVLSGKSDTWIWSWEASGLFSVASAGCYIDDILCAWESAPTRWINLVPKKVNILAWRLSLNKLPTRHNISLRGMDIQSILYPICKVNVEHANHLLLSCMLAREIYKRIFKWCGISVVMFSSYIDWLTWFASLKIRKPLAVTSSPRRHVYTPNFKSEDDLVRPFT
ncbi:RNA-directed DNA polymerase, eukaryota [Tanacetum coccineum]|uniref:RNA-directed DNA polymerase, eukaryota n=1 Tax=Tanacetum coccineum TaxID=301880 RepID=A0ABQ4X7Q3_9ASTR